MPMRIYLDHNATTPLREEVVDAMLPCLRGGYGNPSSTHAEGAAARAALEAARAQVAALLGARPEEVLFTAGATEANNTVIHTAVSRGSGSIVTSAVEHPSVDAACEAARAAGVEVREVGSDTGGRVDAGDFVAACGSDARLATLIWANNETGVVQPVESIAEALGEAGVPLHLDATQALGKWPVRLDEVPAASLSCSAHKLGGPKGVGALVAGSQARDGVRGLVAPLLLGGGQERGLRGGTENVAGIVGFGRACALAREELSERIERYASLRDRLWEGLVAKVPRVRRNGDPEHVLPNTLNVEFEATPGEVLLQALDLEGVAVSAGAACHSGSISPSKVLVAMGLDAERARSSLRLSVGHGVDEAQVDRVVALLAELVPRVRAARRP